MPTFKGNNNLSSEDIFNQRAGYLYRGYSSLITPIDLWYNTPLYGRLDLNGATIYPIENKLKRLESAPDENIFALNFVVDAFEDFRKHYIFSQQFNVKGSMFDQLIPKKGYENPLLNWHDYSNGIFTLFKKDYLTTDKREQKILSFKDYIIEFELFMKEFGPKMPLTLTNYFLSTQVSPLISGIMIELSEADHGDDLSKSIFYMENKGFNCYAEAARQYGFKVDKNAPWRLVADLKSPMLEPYLQKYGLSFLTLFKEYYNKTYTTEVNLIKNFLFDSYSAFVGESPSVAVYQYSSRCKKTLRTIFNREAFMEERINQQFSDSFWIGYYIQILSNEMPNLITPGNILDLTAVAQTLVKNESPEAAQKIIFNSFNKTGLTTSKKYAII